MVKSQGLQACGATFRYIVPLPIFFLTRLLSKQRLKRKDFQQIAHLPWAQEVWSSNLHAPTNLILRLTGISKKSFPHYGENSRGTLPQHPSFPPLAVPAAFSPRLPAFARRGASLVARTCLLPEAVRDSSLA
jgi:hypothetical protein